MEVTAPSASALSAATRQKSCNACVKAKRRCDKRTPICRRCAEKNYACVYRKRPPGNFTSSLADGDAAAAAEEDEDEEGFTDPGPPPAGSSSAAGPPAGVNPFDFDFANIMNSGIDVGTGTLVDNAPLNDTNMDTSLGFLDGLDTMETCSGDMWLLDLRKDSIDLATEPESGAEPAAYDSFDFDKMNDLSEFEPWHVYDPTTKVHFVVNAFKAFPITFARDHQTPFIHRFLHKDHMPASIMQCFTASAVYAATSEQTRSTVFRVLQQGLRELLGPESAGLTATTPQDRLARTQSLLLYQAIRIFDGDVTLRSAAERDMPLLSAWLDDLCKISDNLSGVINTGAQLSPPSSWERWIFAESIRRTIVIGYTFVTMHQMLYSSGDDCDTGPWSFIHRWTLSRPLWEAQSSFDFYCRWRERPQYIIENFEFENFLKLGKGDDVDDMGRLMLTTYMGVDETKQFMLDTGVAT